MPRVTSPATCATARSQYHADREAATNRQCDASTRFGECAMEGLDKSINLRLLCDERRRELDGVSPLADIEALVPACPGDVIRSPTRSVRRGGDTDASGQSKVTDIGDVLRLGE